MIACFHSLRLFMALTAVSGWTEALTIPIGAPLITMMTLILFGALVLRLVDSLECC